MSFFHKKKASAKANAANVHMTEAEAALAQSDFNIDKILDIQNKFTGGTALLVPGRIFIREGMLWKVCRKGPKKRQFFLFNDILVYGSVVAGRYSNQHVLPLAHMVVSSAPSYQPQTNTTFNIDSLDEQLDVHNAFQISHANKSFHVFSLSQADKANWLANLQKHINKVALVGGNQTVVPRAVWVPDSHSKECMVCGQKFTAFNRKHHCRQCGRVVCSTCSPHRVIIDSQTDAGKPERVCSGCVNEVTTIKSKGSPEINAKQPPAAVTTAAAQVVSSVLRHNSDHQATQPQSPPSPRQRRDSTDTEDSDDSETEDSSPPTKKKPTPTPRRTQSDSARHNTSTGSPASRTPPRKPPPFSSSVRRPPPPNPVPQVTPTTTTTATTTTVPVKKESPKPKPRTRISQLQTEEPVAPVITEPAPSEEAESVTVKERPSHERVAVASEEDSQPTPPPRKRKKAKLKQQMEHQLQQKMKEQEQTLPSTASSDQGGSELNQREDEEEGAASSKQEEIEIVKDFEVSEIVEGNESIKEALPAEDVVTEHTAEEVIGTVENTVLREEIVSDKGEKEVEEDEEEEEGEEEEARAVEVGEVEGFEVVDALENDKEEEDLASVVRENEDEAKQGVSRDEVISGEEEGETVMGDVTAEDVGMTSDKKEMARKPRRKKKHFRDEGSDDQQDINSELGPNETTPTDSAHDEAMPTTFDSLADQEANSTTTDEVSTAPQTVTDQSKLVIAGVDDEAVQEPSLPLDTVEDETPVKKPRGRRPKFKPTES